jgi:hypothetical protein
MSSIIANNEPSIFISHVFPNKANMVESVFIELFGSCIDKVDIVKNTRNGEDICRAYIHFKWWPTTHEAKTLREKLLNGDTVKVIYEKTWFWKCVASKFNNGDNNSSLQRGPYIELGDEHYQRVCSPDEHRNYRGPPRAQREYRDTRGPQREYREPRGAPPHQREYRDTRGPQREYRGNRETRVPPHHHNKHEFSSNTHNDHSQRVSSKPHMMPRQLKLKIKKPNKYDMKNVSPATEPETKSCDEYSNDEDVTIPPPSGLTRQTTGWIITEEKDNVVSNDKDIK